MILERRTFDRNQGINGNRLGMRRQRGQLMEQPHSVHVALPQPNNASSTHGNTSLSNTLNRIQSILIFSRRRHLFIILWRRIQIVIIRSQTSLPQLFCLLWCQHAKSRTHFHIQRTNTLHSIQHPLPLPLPHLRRTPPRRPHTEPCTPSLLGPHRSLIHIFQIHQLFRLGPSLFTPMTRLTTIITILWTPSRLDTQQCATLYHGWVIVLTVD
mmetsp:Transcript_11233/g.22424  ORF Transcript_11233/g.22424 Transcript_11233/m.22424 type:complete len:212 (+) Transcript_11233:1073-1708(+)